MSNNKNNNWEEIIEEGQVFYINNKLGNILKINNETYVSMMPKIIKLGPFKTLESAKQALTESQETINEVLDNFNNDLIMPKESYKKEDN